MREGFSALESGSDIVADYIAEGAEAAEIDYDSSIMGLEIDPGDCVRIVVGRFMVIGRVVSRTKTIVIIEDLWGITHSLYVSKITMVSKIPCSMLGEIKEQIELRRALRKKKASRKKPEGGG